MTYQNEPDANRRNNTIDDTYFTHWIIVGAVSLAIVILAAAFTSTEKYPDMPQTMPQTMTTVIAPAPLP